ncbi:hypothetical protein [Tamlana sp. I1]|uniref:hypothetical protein n=1 Tax=Tamlana sp. I1 TaxID=2762061 RepID=UPI00188F5250|nr:hypothetical protein [Tamlana sp. I1]
MKYFNYFLIIFGAFVAMYGKTNSNSDQSQYLLIGGIVMLMIGVYRVAKTVPSKHEHEDAEDDV